MVLFCDTSFQECRAALANRLRDAPGISVQACQRADLADAIAEADVAVPLMVAVSEDIIAKGHKLKLINQWGVGLEGVDIPAATRQSIHVCRYAASLLINGSIAENFPPPQPPSPRIQPTTPLQG